MKGSERVGERLWKDCVGGSEAERVVTGRLKGGSLKGREEVCLEGIAEGFDVGNAVGTDDGREDGSHDGCGRRARRGGRGGK